MLALCPRAWARRWLIGCSGQIDAYRDGTVVTEDRSGCKLRGKPDVCLPLAFGARATSMYRLPRTSELHARSAACRYRR